MFGHAYYGARYYAPRYFGGAAADLAEVPNVVGETEAAGTATLEGAGFVVAVSPEYSDTVSIGDIISQTPNGGTDAELGSVVVIFVSMGASVGADFMSRMRRRGRRG